MPRSEEAEAFFVAVYEAVQEIPYGKVTSYGHIARITGYPKLLMLNPQFGTNSDTLLRSRPRQALKHLPAGGTPNTEFNGDNVPWQRVINSQGVISQRDRPGGVRRQADALESEGVIVTTARDGQMSVDFAEFGWFPTHLPSREGESDDDEESGEEGA